MAGAIYVRALQPKRRRAGLEFGPEPREFTGEEFAALFAPGLASVIAFAAIVTDPLLSVQVREDEDLRDITPGEIDQLHSFLEAESAKVDQTDPPTDDAAEAQAAAEAEANAAAAAAADEPDQPAEAPALNDNPAEDHQPEGAEAAAPSADPVAGHNAKAEEKAASNEPLAADAKPTGRKSKG